MSGRGVNWGPALSLSSFSFLFRQGFGRRKIKIKRKEKESERGARKSPAGEGGAGSDTRLGGATMNQNQALLKT
jgi:hypothetical protein